MRAIRRMRVPRVRGVRPVVVATQNRQSSSSSASSPPSASREERIETVLRSKLQPSELIVEDFSGGCDGGTVQVFVASSLFEGKSLVEQHQMVSGAMSDEMATIHALNIKTKVATKE